MKLSKSLRTRSNLANSSECNWNWYAQPFESISCSARFSVPFLCVVASISGPTLWRFQFLGIAVRSLRLLCALSLFLSFSLCIRLPLPISPSACVCFFTVFLSCSAFLWLPQATNCTRYLSTCYVVCMSICLSVCHIFPGVSAVLANQDRRESACLSARPFALALFLCLFHFVLLFCMYGLFHPRKIRTQSSGSVCGRFVLCPFVCVFLCPSLFPCDLPVSLALFLCLSLHVAPSVSACSLAVFSVCLCLFLSHCLPVFLSSCLVCACMQSLQVEKARAQSLEGRLQEAKEERTRSRAEVGRLAGVGVCAAYCLIMVRVGAVVYVSCQCSGVFCNSSVVKAGALCREGRGRACAAKVRIQCSWSYEG